MISRGSFAAVGMTGGLVTGTGVDGLVAVGGTGGGLDVAVGVGGTGVSVADGLAVAEGLTVGVGLGTGVADGGAGVGIGVTVGGIVMGVETRVAVAGGMEAGVLQPVRLSIVAQTMSTGIMWAFMGPPVVIARFAIVALGVGNDSKAGYKTRIREVVSKPAELSPASVG